MSLTTFAHFDADRLIEGLAGLVVCWLFTGRRLGSERAERLAQQLIAGSWVGMGLAAFTAPTMPLLARAKRRVGHELKSAATSGAVSALDQGRWLEWCFQVGHGGHDAHSPTP